LTQSVVFIHFGGWQVAAAFGQTVHSSAGHKPQTRTFTGIVNRNEMSYKKIMLDGIGWLFGLALFAAGIVNTFWGNDQGLGIGLLVLAFVYFPPVTAFVQRKTGRTIPWAAKLVLALLLAWVTLGVGELLPKVGLMLKDLR
jgi:hypothetical protein